MPRLPEHKALLSTDGGICPDDGTALAFDPRSPRAHRCPRCGKSYAGERHERHWARFQHLWLAERAAHLAALQALGGGGGGGGTAPGGGGGAAFRGGPPGALGPSPTRHTARVPRGLFFAPHL